MVLKASLEQLGSTDNWGDFVPNSSSTGNKTNTCWLNQFSALKIYGPDTERFLQGQLTCDIKHMETNTVVFGACCNAKGRVVANFIISFDGENYWLVLPSNSALTLQKHLQKYKVFFKTEIENCAQSHLILGQWVDGIQGSVQHNEDSQQLLQITPQRRVIISVNESPTSFEHLVATVQWHLEDMNEGIYFVEQDQQEVWVPQHINWHHLDGVSFNKGCYTGQEIIARLQYLGKAKKALYHYHTPSIDENVVAGLVNTSADQEESVATRALYNADGKNMGKILFGRTLANTTNNNNDADATTVQCHLQAVLNTDAPDEVLYLSKDKQFPVTLVPTQTKPSALSS